MAETDAQQQRNVAAALVAHDGTFQTASAWAARRWSTPGAIVGGRLRTTDVQQVNMGVEEFVDHSFYENWTSQGARLRTDPSGNPLSAHHPSNKDTIPQPGQTDPARQYSWCTAPRRQPMEPGAHAHYKIPRTSAKAPGCGAAPAATSVITSPSMTR